MEEKFLVLIQKYQLRLCLLKIFCPRPRAASNLRDNNAVSEFCHRNSIKGDYKHSGRSVLFTVANETLASHWSFIENEVLGNFAQLGVEFSKCSFILFDLGLGWHRGLPE